MKLFEEKLKENSKREIAPFNGKIMKKLLQQGYYIDTVDELWFDSDEGLTFNNWVDEYGEGIWGMNQREVNAFARRITSNFSHFMRRQKHKAIPRSYREVGTKGIMYYLFLRDKWWRCDYAIFFAKRKA